MRPKPTDSPAPARPNLPTEAPRSAIVSPVDTPAFKNPLASPKTLDPRSVARATLSATLKSVGFCANNSLSLFNNESAVLTNGVPPVLAPTIFRTP